MAVVSKYPEIVAASIRARFGVGAVRDLGSNGPLFRWRVALEGGHTLLVEFTESALLAVPRDLQVWLDIIELHAGGVNAGPTTCYRVTPAGVFYGDVLLCREVVWRYPMASVRDQLRPA